MRFLNMRQSDKPAAKPDIPAPMITTGASLIPFCLKMIRAARRFYGKIIENKIDFSSPDFEQNAQRMNALVHDLTNQGRKKSLTCSPQD